MEKDIEKYWDELKKFLNDSNYISKKDIDKVDICIKKTIRSKKINRTLK